MKTMTDSFQRITGRFRERMFLSAAPQRQMHVHVPSQVKVRYNGRNPGGKVAPQAVATTGYMANQPKKRKTEGSR